MFAFKVLDLEVFFNSGWDNIRDIRNEFKKRLFFLPTSVSGQQATAMSNYAALEIVMVFKVVWATAACEPIAMKKSQKTNHTEYRL